jgi:hypothetical protein
MKYCHICTILGAIGAAIELMSVQTTTGISAPQQAAGAAIAVAMVVIPYCLARGLVAMSTSAEEAQLKRLNETIETHTRLLAEMANTSAREVHGDVSAG